jgi:hypothetical protein
MKFKRRHGEFEQGCVMSESFTATDALPPIPPACRQPLLPACVFVPRDTVRHPRLFCSENLFVNRFVRDERRSWTEVPLYFFPLTISILVLVRLTLIWSELLLFLFLLRVKVRGVVFTVYFTMYLTFFKLKAYYVHCRTLFLLRQKGRCCA